MKPIILFDVDRTLFDNDLFSQKIKPILLKECALSEQEYLLLSKSYIQSLKKNTDFDPDELLKFITKQDDISSIKEKTFANQQLYLDSVFNDARPILEKLKVEYRLGVFSEAKENWQYPKLKMTNLIQYFDPKITFIARRKTKTSFLEIIPENAIIIDDNLDVISELIAFNTFIPIWLNRKNKDAKLKVATITKLDELSQLLTTLGKHE